MGVITRNIRRAVTWFGQSSAAQMGAAVAGSAAIASRRMGDVPSGGGSAIIGPQGTPTIEGDEDDVTLGSERSRQRGRQRGRRQLMRDQQQPQQRPTGGAGLQV